MSLEVNINTQTKRMIPEYTLEFKKDAARLGKGIKIITE